MGAGRARAAGRGYRPGGGFTLVEVLVVLAVITILAAFLFPVFAQARERGRRAQCLSNLKQIGVALFMYAGDYDDVLPHDVIRLGDLSASDPCSAWNPYGRIEARLWPYVRNTEVFACSSSNTPPVVWDDTHLVCARSGWGYPDFFCFPHEPARGKQLSYGWNGLAFQLTVGPPQEGCTGPPVPLAAVASPAGKIMAGDSHDAFLDPFELSFANYPGASAFFASNAGAFWLQLAAAKGSATAIVPEAHTRHQMGQNVLFFDGHVSWLPYQAFIGPSIQDTAGKWFNIWQ